MHILRNGFFSVKQYKARTGFSGTLGPHFLTTLFLSCVCITDVLITDPNTGCQVIDEQILKKITKNIQLIFNFISNSTKLLILKKC